MSAIAEPTKPDCWHSQEFFSPDEWRDAAERWEALANEADGDGDSRDAEYCRAQAAGCRANARRCAMARRPQP